MCAQLYRRLPFWYSSTFYDLSSQAIEYTFHRRSTSLAESIDHIIQHFSFKAMAIIDAAKVGGVLFLIKVCKIVFLELWETNPNHNVFCLYLFV